MWTPPLDLLSVRDPKRKSLESTSGLGGLSPGDKSQHSGDRGLSDRDRGAPTLSIDSIASTWGTDFSQAEESQHVEHKYIKLASELEQQQQILSDSTVGENRTE